MSEELAQLRAPLLAHAGVDCPHTDPRVFHFQNWSGLGWSIMQGDNPAQLSYVDGWGVLPCLPGGTAADPELVQLQQAGDRDGFKARLMALIKNEGAQKAAPGQWGTQTWGSATSSRVNQLCHLFVDARMGDIAIMTSSGKMAADDMKSIHTQFAIAVFTTEPTGVRFMEPAQIGGTLALTAGSISSGGDSGFVRTADGGWIKALCGPLAVRPVKWVRWGRMSELPRDVKSYFGQIVQPTICQVHGGKTLIGGVHAVLRGFLEASSSTPSPSPPASGAAAAAEPPAEPPAEPAADPPAEEVPALEEAPVQEPRTERQPAAVPRAKRPREAAAAPAVGHIVSRVALLQRGDRVRVVWGEGRVYDGTVQTIETALERHGRVDMAIDYAHVKYDDGERGQVWDGEHPGGTGAWEVTLLARSVSVHDLDTGETELSTLDGSAQRKRRRSGDAGSTSAPSVLKQLVALTEEKKQVRRSLNEAQEDLEDSEELVSQQALMTNFLQGKMDELKALALRAGADPNAVKEIMERKYKA